MENRVVHHVQECPDCGVGTEQGLFHTARGQSVCAECLTQLVVLSQEPVVLVGVTTVDV